MTAYTALRQAIIDGDAPKAKELVQQGIDQGVPAGELVSEALVPAMHLIGEQFSAGGCYVSELLLAGRAMQGALGLLEPLLGQNGGMKRGKVVLGTVQGDLHDIGKNLVSIMLKGGGFEVVDLGTNVQAARFVEAVRETGAGLVMMSALLTTAMPAMKATIAALEHSNLRDKVKVAVGGAPVTQRFADEIGADFYAADAGEAVRKATALAAL